jgi:peroxiredoxin
MSKLLPSLLVAAAAAILPSLASAQPEATPAKPAPAARPTAGIQTEFKPLFDRIQAKLAAGKHTPGDLAAELKDFDALLARHRGEKTDDVAIVSLMKARLYLEVFEDKATGAALLKQIKADFPESRIAADIDQVILAIEKEIAAETLLAPGKPFPPFSEKDLDGQPLSLAAYRGKIVLIDFWATWCGPCVAELPNVLAAYEKYHGRGFEIVGISLDQDKAALTSFIKEHQMTWAQYFDGLGWKNKLGQEYGINAIPATFLVDGEGKIVARNLRGDALAKKLAELLK